MSTKHDGRCDRGLVQQVHRGCAGPRLRASARKAALAETKGNATTLVLDLHDQWQNFVKTGQYRFTPPIHVIVSFHQALMEFFAEGGQPGRGERYADNGKVLIDGMKRMGFQTAAAAQSAGADHRHVPHAEEIRVRVPDVSMTR